MNEFEGDILAIWYWEPNLSENYTCDAKLRLAREKKTKMSQPFVFKITLLF